MTASPGLGSQPQPGYANGWLEVAAPLPAVQASHSGVQPAVLRVPPRESRLVMRVPSRLAITASSPHMILRTAGARG
jgi:hypothetical protein